MPTLLVVDVSLSMSRHVSSLPPDDDATPLQRRNLAIHGVNAFLDCLTAQSKLEFVALVTSPKHSTLSFMLA